MKTRHRLLLGIVALGFGLGPGAAQAGPVKFTVGSIAAPTDVVVPGAAASGTEAYAFSWITARYDEKLAASQPAHNYGSHAPASAPALQKVNGVPFILQNVGGEVNSTAVMAKRFGNVSIKCVGSDDSAWSPAPEGAFAKLAKMDDGPAYQSILHGFVFGTAAAPLSVTVGHLEAGQPCTVVFWVNLSSHPGGNEPTTITCGEASVSVTPNVANAEGGLGHFVTATFEAESESQTFLLTSAWHPQLNAIEVIRGQGE
jgi:hypothetical protein